MRHQQDNSAAMAVVLGAVFFLLFIIFKLSEGLDVDMNTGANVFLCLFSVALMTFGLFYFEIFQVKPSATELISIVKLNFAGSL